MKHTYLQICNKGEALFQLAAFTKIVYAADHLKAWEAVNTAQFAVSDVA